MPLQKSHIDEIYVDGYYSPDSGPTQKCNMFRIDLDEAMTAHPDEWFSEPPPGGEVVEMSPKKMILEEAPLPHVPLTTAQVQRKVRTGVAGSP